MSNDDPMAVGISEAEMTRASLLITNAESLHGLRAVYQGRPVMVLVIEERMNTLPGYVQSIPVAVLMDRVLEDELELPPGVTRQDPREN